MKRNLDKQALDDAGKRLVKQAVVTAGDIGNIVARPDLFELVTRRIADEQGRATLAQVSMTPARAIAFVAAPAALGVALGAIVMTSESPVADVRVSQVPDTIPEVTRPAIPPQGIVSINTAGRDDNPRFEKAVTVRDRVRTRKSSKTRPTEDNAPADDFYTIAYTPHADETAGGRIVRVDLDRTSAFALGIDLPLENGAATVKADLLIGTDGVTRAIRVIK